MFYASLIFASLLNILSAADVPVEKPLFQFGKQFDLASVEANDATPGISGNALSIATGQKERWPGVTLKAPGEFWDLSPYGFVALDVKNTGINTVQVSCRVDSPGGGGATNSITGSITLAPGKQQTLQIPLRKKMSSDMRKIFFGMRGYPGGFDEQRGIDTAKADKLIIFVNNPKAEHVFEISNIRAGGTIAFPLPADQGKWFPMIDALGQYMHKDWPGKIHISEELQKRKAEEAADLAAHPGPADWDQYGGWKNGPQLEATGRFRVEKVDGRWWLVDPDGRLFWSNGIDCIEHGHDTTAVTNREQWFAALPAPETPMANFYGRGINRARGDNPNQPVGTYNFPAANLFRKYGDDWKDQFTAIVHRRLRSWGLNTIGNWSSSEIYLTNKTPYTATASVQGRRLSGGGSRGLFIDVFDPGFADAARQAVARHKDKAAGDPWCLGYFVDNELGWDDELSLAMSTLASPADQPAKKVFLDDLKAKYKTIEKLNQAWESQYASWDALLESTTLPKINGAGQDREPGQKARDDLSAFYTKSAERYFQVCRDAVKETDPQGLYLGCRFAGSNDRVVRAAAKYCDVVSFNKYQRSVADLRLPSGDDKPIIIGEFHFGALDRGMPHPGLVPTADQQDRANSYSKYVASALLNPNIVGAHFFQFSDQPFTGRFDGENYQIGFVDVCDTPNPEIIKASREIGSKLYAERLGNK
jgi:Beta-galactosidase